MVRGTIWRIFLVNMRRCGGMNPACRCCEKKISVDGARQCPEFGHIFKGHGWDGIDAHWRAHHEQAVRYEEFWKGLCEAHRGR